jgi:phosphoribosyl 1,2-cyclic phosphodiesterase
MNVTVLGSGSRGNAIAFAHRGATLLVDAGFGARTLERRAKRMGVSLAPLAGIVLTHEHGDHARGATTLARRHSSPVYGSSGTLRALRSQSDGVPLRVIDCRSRLQIGPFMVSACPTSHDAAEPLCVAVEDAGAAVKVGVAYDLGRPTAAVQRLMRDCTCLIVEANHDDQLLRVGPYPVSVQRRIAGAAGHLSNHASARLLAGLCHARLRTVVLAHLSDRCNRPEVALQTVRPALAAQGFRGSLLVASQDDPLQALIGEGAQLQLSL